jgi:hypothetical protein
MHFYQRFAETMINLYYKQFKLDTKIIRLFRTYGPRMKLHDDQMIPDFISNAMDNKDLVIFGDKDFSSSLCYISDVIDAIIKITASKINEAVNILNLSDDEVVVNVQADEPFIEPDVVQLVIDKVKELKCNDFTMVSCFKDINSENKIVQNLKHEMSQLLNISKTSGAAIAELALNYCLQQHTIDNVLIGVDSKQQLEDNLNSLNYTLENSTANEINNINVSNINLLNPSLWK